MILRIRGGNELIDPEKALKEGGIQIGFKVADLGCGNLGHFVFPAAEMVGEKGVVYAVDILPAVLQNIQNQAKFLGVTNVVPVWADLEKINGMKIENGSIDLALLINTLFQVKDKETVLKEAWRILKTGGTLLVGDWKLESSPLGPPLALRVNPKDIQNLAEKVGFILERSFELGPYHFGLIFKKK